MTGLIFLGRNNNHRKKTNVDARTSLFTESDGIRNDANLKEVVLPCVDEPMAMEVQSPLVDQTHAVKSGVESYPPLPTQGTTPTGNTPSKFLYANVIGDSSRKALNFHFKVWKMMIEDVLVQQGIDEALEEKQPKEMKDDVWKTMLKKDSSTISLALALEIKCSVLKEKTPKDIWDKLTNICASKSLTHRLFLKMELYSLKLEEDSNLHDHINSFNQLVCQLANDVLKALRDNERMMGSDSSSSSNKFLAADDSGRDLKSLRDSKGKNKVNDGEMNVVDNAGDEYLMKETPMNEILIEEKPWIMQRVRSVRFKLHDGSLKTALNVNYLPGAAMNILSLGVLTSCGEALQGRTCCRGNKRKMKIEKRVHFSDKDEV
nr:retrovirus-related Pol polyprotein from transposon TNT 1-94 [Tanacetum cinerariifolium]